ncbi:MAG: hypothetical protein IKR19_07775 [Acholeplasmatales bacterium]|nr:hypothetical protein [Acholeplasmatales bacterium]
MLLMYGNLDPRLLDSNFLDAKNPNYLKSDSIAFNISTYREDFHKLASLLPPRELGLSSNYEFDVAYANYILGNDVPFCEFFSIIYYLYMNKDVYLIVNPDDWAEDITESLLKLIQQRYGVNGVLVNSEEDYQYAKISANVSFASGSCLWNLDTDKERYTATITNIIMQVGYNPFPVIFDFSGE